MTSSYPDPLLMSAIAAQQEYEKKKEPSALDVIGGLALGAGIGALAGRGIIRGMRRGAVKPVTVQDLGNTGFAAEPNVRRAAAPPPPSRPAPGPTASRQARAEEFVRQARAQRPTGVSQVDLSSIEPKALPAYRPKLIDQLFQTSRFDTGTPYSAEDIASIVAKQADLPETGKEYINLSRIDPFKDPNVSSNVIQARRQARADQLARIAARPPETYQLELGGEVSPTLRQIRSSEFGPNLTQARREALGLAEETATSPELSFIRSSIPLTETPKQFNIFNYLEDQGYKESTATDIPYQGTRSAITSTTPAVESGGDAADRLILEFQQLSERQARADQRAQASVREYQMRVRGAGERILDELKQETLVERQNKIKGFNVDQAVNAVESGEDQMTGRVKQQLQRNEDLDLTQVELMEEVADANYLAGMEQDEPINQVASRLPDGLPADQAEDIQGSSAFRFMQAEREKIKKELFAFDKIPTPTRVETELTRRLGSQASTYDPKYTARRQALELYAKTGDPKLLETVKRFGLSPVTFETFENMPAEKRRLFETRPPMSLEGYPSEELIAKIPRSGIEINIPAMGRVDISTIRKPVITEKTALAAEEFVGNRKEQALTWLSNLQQELEPQLNEIFSERRALIENQAAQLKPLLEQAQATGDVNKTKQIESQLNVLRYQFKNPQSHPHRRDESNLLNARLNKAERKIQEDIQGIQRKYPTTLEDWSGGTNRVFGELDVNTGEFIPETMELRSDRPALDIGSKGGGGRSIAEYTAGERLDEEIRAIQGGGRIRDYDPETGAAYQPWTGDRTQTGREIDIYGVRPSGEKTADPTKPPSEPQYTQQEIMEEAMRLTQADPYGDVPVAPNYESIITSLGSQVPTPERRRSVLMSEQVRKGQLQFPQQKISSYPSSLLARPVRINFPQEQIAPAPVQLSFPSDVVPEGGRARVRQTAADVAANQLEAYMSKLQRGRSTPLTSAVRIQPSLF